MKRLFWALVVWHLGTAAAWAAPWWEGRERLDYAVAWSGLSVGKAQLTYAAGAKGAYGIDVGVKDDSIFMTLVDSWHVRGGPDWTSQTWEAVQRENSYRAHKRLTFGKPAAGKVTFENLKSPAEPVEVVDVGVGARDVMSALYAWRAEGPAGLKVPRTRVVVAGKRPVDLTVSKGVPVPMALAGGQKVTAMRVEMQVPRRKGKGVDTWTVWVTDDAEMVPLKIEAQLKFGTFTATLTKRSEG